jgi:talin
MPPAYRKKQLKDMEKQVRKEYKAKVGMQAMNAKLRYVQLCRSLPTWGISHYLVEERRVNPKTKKTTFAPIRLGITRSSVILLDTKTYEKIKEWPLVKVKRWAASERSFTLDFGDHEDDYYVVRTTHGEDLAQQIAGYIDIILKQRRGRCSPEF